jgi:diguanylate cyclase (GGDEF)-like protein/PAS domain S-box-containing protein
VEDATGGKLDITVLYAEDELPARDKIARILRRQVRDLHLANNGREGFELFMRHRPDVVITDIRMPLMNGLEMAEKIKAVDRKTPVVITTAHSETDFFQKSIEIGIDRYLLKPVDAFKLQEILGELANNIRMERALREQTRLLEEYKRAVDESNIVCKTDNQDRIIYLNDEFCKVSGYTKTDLLGKPHEIILHPKTQESLLKELQHTILSKKIWKGILEYTRKSSNIYYADVTIVPLLDLENNIIEFIYIGHDVTELVDLTKWLKQLSSTDSLTQIYNRMAFNDIIETELNRTKRYKTDLSLIMFDIDHFKNVNDTYGHMTGDNVLRSLVDLVKQKIRTVDIFARWGGEEFMLLTPETSPEAAYDLAERLRIAIEEHLFASAGKVTASFGVASFKGDDSPDILTKRVDQALYRAKEGGRNRVETG